MSCSWVNCSNESNERLFPGSSPDFQKQSACSPLPVKYCGLSGVFFVVSMLHRTLLAPRHFFLMLQKQIPREGFPPIWPFPGLRKIEVLKITSSNIHRFDTNVARNLGWIQPAASWKMKKEEKTEQIKCSRPLTLWVSHGAPLATMKEKMQTCQGWLPACIPENRQACSAGSSRLMQSCDVYLLPRILSTHWYIHSYDHVSGPFRVSYLHTKSRSRAGYQPGPGLSYSPCHTREFPPNAQVIPTMKFLFGAPVVDT